MKTKILLIAVLLILSSCSYFRVIPESNYSAQSIKQYDDDGKYIVLHRGEVAWHAYYLYVANDSLYMKLDYHLGYHVEYLVPKEKGLNKFYMKIEPDVVNAIHIYTSDTTFNSFDIRVAIPVSSISAVKSFEYARAPSRASKIVPAVFLPIAGLVILSAIALSQMSFSMSF